MRMRTSELPGRGERETNQPHCSEGKAAAAAARTVELTLEVCHICCRN